MRELTAGHKYELDHLDGEAKSYLNFVNRNEGEEEEGTVNQEVLRALIKRVYFLDGQINWELNEKIVYHLRMAIALHEARALIRKVEKHNLKIEDLELDTDLHIKLTFKDNQS